MRKAAAGNDSANVSPAFSSALNATRGGGSPLPVETRNFMENAFSADFSSVRIHSDNQAAEMSKGINAKAFTYRDDIYFNEGRYDYHSREGKHLLGHELTHVLQQSNELMQPAIQRKEENNSALAAIQGLPMYELLTKLVQLPENVRNDEDAGDLVGGPRLLVAMWAVREKIDQKQMDRGALYSLYKDQRDEILAFLNKPIEMKEWAVNEPSTTGFKGEQIYSVTTLTKEELYDAITQVAPELPHILKVMLLGQAWLEQQGKLIINYNFAGMEGSSSAYVMARTSTVITAAEYNGNKSAYSDWGKGNVWHGKDAGTIEVQLARGETQLVVMKRKPRPAYQSIVSAAAAFIQNVESKFHALQRSSDQAHHQLVDKALGGDVQAYAQIVSLLASKLGIYPYNPDPGYPALVVKQIEQARLDLASRAPGPSN